MTLAKFGLNPNATSGLRKGPGKIIEFLSHRGFLALYLSSSSLSFDSIASI